MAKNHAVLRPPYRKCLPKLENPRLHVVHEKFILSGITYHKRIPTRDGHYTNPMLYHELDEGEVEGPLIKLSNKDTVSNTLFKVNKIDVLPDYTFSLIVGIRYCL